MNKKNILDFNISNRNRMVSRMKANNPNFNLDNPKTIQEKLCWLNIYDVDAWDDFYGKPLKTICADKLLVKDYAANKVCENIGIPTLKVYDKASDIKWDELPNEFVIKCNHGSGMNIICNDKSKFDFKEAENKLDVWMYEDYTFRHGFESHYHWIDRKIIVEPLMKNKNSNSLFDYKFWCFNGKPKFYTINDGNGHGAIIHYDMNQKQMGLERKDYPVPKGMKYEQPRNFDKMVQYASKLSEDFKFVRVDFYEINNKVYLGELTFTPGVCNFQYKNEADNLNVGNLLKL